MSYMSSAPKTMTVAESPGIPKTKAGIHAPLGPPFPKISPFLDVRCATPYAALAAMSAPALGSAPITVPKIEDFVTVGLCATASSESLSIRDSFLS